jgi:glucosamine--fructose-6-phosphate aminotransferase (isomerizing)
MCGIVGYTGKKAAFDLITEGLSALEYRGYDSAGIALIDKTNKAHTYKQVGGVQKLTESVNKTGNPLKAHFGIGHTRWATHGEPNVINAHPHTNTDKSVFVVHNGIIENYREIKALLEDKGYVFVTETDTEVIPHLIDYHLRKNKNFTKAFQATLQDLHGAYAIAAVSVSEPETLYIARLSSPLVIGVGNGEHIVASDPTAVLSHTKKVIYLNDYEYAVVTPKKVTVQSVADAKKVHHTESELDFDIDQAKLGNFEHYMIKEIYEIPDTIRTATRGRVKLNSNSIKLGGLESVEQQLRYIDRIVIVACGTASYAGLLGEYLIEEIAGIPVEVQIGSEFKYRNEPFSRSTALLAISQSGETADTIAAIKKVEGYGVLKLGIVNAVGSTIARMTDAGVYCHAGPEQSVASTKAFIAQVTVLIEIALFLSQGRTKLYKPLLQELLALPEKAERILANTKDIQEMAKKYSSYRDFLFIGRGYMYPCAMEGAIKLKEISYIHAEGYAAGEMKHGPLAMIDESFATFALAPDSPLLDKTISNIEEIRARKGPVLALATEGNKQVNHLTKDILFIPKTHEQLQPLLAAIVLQLFAYYVACEKGLNVDRPRNLAKSVTVE